jgi:ABC-2 type transport system ATP-binding protein
MDHVIEVTEVSKTFKIHHERHQSVKDRVLHPRSGRTELFSALNNISFTVDAGETVGILGHNGSGKSTLLKCVCGVLQPTTGVIRQRGSLAALLELGAGFQVELSGRDNVYLYGTMLGFSRKYIDRIFDDIVAFSEIEHFIDTQVKFYSSGMYVRLAFAVAVNVDPDVLVVDEVLAVGDERFQAKCIDRIKGFQEDGKAILLVTHSAEQVRTLASRAIVLESGSMIAHGDVGESLKIFRDHLLGPSTNAEGVTMSGGEVQIEGVSSPTGTFDVRSGSSFHFDVQLSATRGLSGLFVLELHTRAGVLVSRSDPHANPIELHAGNTTVGVDLPELPLLDGIFDVNVGVYDPRGSNVLAWAEKVATIQVSYSGREGGLVELSPSVHQA